MTQHHQEGRGRDDGRRHGEHPGDEHHHQGLA
jgi:hypothetical protein